MSSEAATPIVAAGARIANSRGVPGTAACLVTAPGAGAMLLTNHHVLFGAGAGAGEPVWVVGKEGTEPDFRRAGTGLRGRHGTVSYMGDEYHVDCALVALERAPRVRSAPAWWLAAGESRLGTARSASTGRLAPGDRVFKLGAATGAGEGVVVDVEYPGVAELNGRTHAAPRQILVRPLDDAGPFSAPGDSGAALRDADGAIVGLVWGATDRGESLACHIGPVLACLGVRVALPRRPGRLARRRAPVEVGA